MPGRGDLVSERGPHLAHGLPALLCVVFVSIAVQAFRSTSDGGPTRPRPTKPGAADVSADDGGTDLWTIELTGVIQEDGGPLGAALLEDAGHRYLLTVFVDAATAHRLDLRRDPRERVPAGFHRSDADHVRWSGAEVTQIFLHDGPDGRLAGRAIVRDHEGSGMVETTLIEALLLARGSTGGLSIDRATLERHARRQDDPALGKSRPPSPAGTAESL